MKEEEKKDQQTENVDQKKKDTTGLKGDDAEMSKNSTAVVDESDETVTDSEKNKEYDDTDHEHDYKTPGNESENENTEDAENRSGKKTSEEQTKNTVK